jgi:hypothetical protein
MHILQTYYPASFPIHILVKSSGKCLFGVFSTQSEGRLRLHVINKRNRISVGLSAFDLDNTFDSFSHELFVNLNRVRTSSTSISLSIMDESCKEPVGNPAPRQLKLVDPCIMQHVL